VSRAVASDRLKGCVVIVNGRPKIADPDLADQEWEQNTDHSRAPASVKERLGPTRVIRGGRASSPLTEASAREKNARADLAELEFLEKAGKLVPAQEVERTWAAIVTQVRAGVLGVPSKAKLALPHLSHADLAQLDDLLCQALEAIAASTDASKDSPLADGAAGGRND
jgi:phage terminase Nu1 subunit (DNA packaging protein)